MNSNTDGHEQQFARSDHIHNPFCVLEDLYHHLFLCFRRGLWGLFVKISLKDRRRPTNLAFRVSTRVNLWITVISKKVKVRIVEDNSHNSVHIEI